MFFYTIFVSKKFWFIFVHILSKCVVVFTVVFFYFLNIRLIYVPLKDDQFANFKYKF